MACHLPGTIAADDNQHSLQDLVEQMVAHCTECGLCVQECSFLKRYGTPAKIARKFDPEQQEQLAMPFECSLCGLCDAVCPEPIQPAALFMEMRREAVARGNNRFFEYNGLLSYERKGTSRRFSWYGLPAGCDTILFPGCALPGTRPEQTVQVFSALQALEPNLGIVLDCCTKPSHDLGRTRYFASMFDEMKHYLLSQGVKKVLVACPNCLQMFRHYAPELATTTIYEVLAGSVPAAERLAGVVTIHDPCGSRQDKAAQAAVRSLVTTAGLTVEEMPHTGATTLCCGEGGAVACQEPQFARAWGKKRAEEAAGRRIVTYCAGCTNFLGAHTPASHVVDLLFAPAAAMAGRAKVSRAPFTYLNRLKLKKHFRNHVAAAVCRERTFTADAQPGRWAWLKPLLVLGLLTAVIAAVRLTGATHYLEQEKLRALIAGYGAMAPVIYMLIYAVAPALFLPGLPLTIVGGILFGPVWGVVYSITGATAGACLAFLVARYLARDKIISKLASPRWKKLDREVAAHGWKVVAFTRLIPLFPFNLLNYAFGLTSIRFSHYAAATFIFMLPACIAFIVFSSSLLDLLQGKVSPSFLIGLALVVLVSQIPRLIRRHQQKQADTLPK